MFELVVSLTIATALILAVTLVLDVTMPRERHDLSWRIRIAFMALFSSVINGALSYYAADVPKVIGVRPLFGRIDLEQFALGFVALLLMHDFLNYWIHRGLHRFLWRFHAVHHSPRELTSAAGTFSHPIEAIFRAISLGTLAGFIGFSGSIPLVLAIVIRLQEFYIHSPTAIHFGPIGGLVVDNRTHRVHHSRDQSDYDKNFGVMFTIWDRLFGTYSHPRTWAEVGLRNLDQPRTLWEVIALPWRLRS